MGYHTCTEHKMQQSLDGDGMKLRMKEFVLICGRSRTTCGQVKHLLTNGQGRQSLTEDAADNLDWGGLIRWLEGNRRPCMQKLFALNFRRPFF